jgi:hypothetical protein
MTEAGMFIRCEPGIFDAIEARGHSNTVHQRVRHIVKGTTSKIPDKRVGVGMNRFVSTIFSGSRGT